MRTHAQIIADAVAAHEGVGRLRTALAARGVKVSDPTVRSWERRTQDKGIIPPEYWPTFADLELATLEELAAGAEATRLPQVAAMRDAAA